LLYFQSQYNLIQRRYRVSGREFTKRAVSKQGYIKYDGADADTDAEREVDAAGAVSEVTALMGATSLGGISELDDAACAAAAAMMAGEGEDGASAFPV
jgi:hypothetical protein